MLTLKGRQKVRFCDGLSRRDFMRVGSIGMLGATIRDLPARASADTAVQKNCILLFLVGGPSQLDTWDMKPNAPAEVRGPFRPISTAVPGTAICEHFPAMAKMADKFALIRSLHHREAPIHESGHQLMQTGWLFRNGTEYPHIGSVLSKLRTRQTPLPNSVILPRPIGNTGVSVSHGQDAGYLGSEYAPLAINADPNSSDYREDLERSLTGWDPAYSSFQSATAKVDRLRQELPEGAVNELAGKALKAFQVAGETEKLRDQYGRNTFGQSCLVARRLVERGVGMVTVNMFDTVFNQVTWDCHANGSNLGATLADYQETLCPTFDRAYTSLLHDLEQRGLLDSTLVVAVGEFGRTFKLNNRGGRDHWPGAWTMLMAGGGVQGGRTIGATDRYGAEPKDRPVAPPEVAATIYQVLGIDPGMKLAGPNGADVAITSAAPITELFS